MQTPAHIELLVVLVIVTLAVALIARLIRLPYTLVLVLSGLLLGFLHLLPGVRLDPDVVLFLFLPMLLFEGAWSLQVAELRANWLSIFLFALPGLALSLIITGAILHWGAGLSWLVALLVGTIVSPTDPIAVLALFRQLGIPDRLRSIVEGESLFNDGIGAAAFTTILGLLLFTRGLPGATASLAPLDIGGHLLWLVVGGPILGIALGFLVAYLLRFIDDYLIESTITLSVAYGAFLLGEALQTSGLLAVVTVGLVMGSFGRTTGMSQRTQEATNDLWSIVGYLANSLLFLLVGLQIGAQDFSQALPAIGWAVLGILVGRAAMIYACVPFHNWLVRHHPSEDLSPQWRPVLLFSGLRGALSLVLVLSLPESIVQKNLLVGMVYGIVLFTLLGQGIGLRLLLPAWTKRSAKPAV